MEVGLGGDVGTVEVEGWGAVEGGRDLVSSIGGGEGDFSSSFGFLGIKVSSFERKSRKKVESLELKIRELFVVKLKAL